MLTNYGFRRLFRVWGLDHTFTLRVCRLVSTPSTFRSWLGSGLACRSIPMEQTSEAFPEFDKFYMHPVFPNQFGKTKRMQPNRIRHS